MSFKKYIHIIHTNPTSVTQSTLALRSSSCSLIRWRRQKWDWRWGKNRQVWRVGAHFSVTEKVCSTSSPASMIVCSGSRDHIAGPETIDEPPIFTLLTNIQFIIRCLILGLSVYCNWRRDTGRFRDLLWVTQFGQGGQIVQNSTFLVYSIDKRSHIATTWKPS